DHSGGAQIGADRLPGAEARDDLRASEPGGIPGPDEGQAGQGPEAEGSSVGAGGHREGVGGGRGGRGGIDARIVKGERRSATAQPERTATQTGQQLWLERVRAEDDHSEGPRRRAEQPWPWVVPCNRRTLGFCVGG